MTEPVEIPKQEEPTESVVMQLILTKSGKLKVQGMIDDKIVALGLLELAKDTLFKYWEDQEIVIHKGDHKILNFIRNGKH